MKKKIVTKVLIPLLRFYAKNILRNHKPLLIGVTGSVGKSSTKEAIYCVLKNHFKCRRSKGNLNNEIGLPLTIIGDSDPRGNVLEWIKILIHGFLLSFLKSSNYPRILILEMASDKPGDMRYLTKIAPCQIGVLTGIGVSHMEFFHDEKQILKEKSELVRQINSEGIAVLNYDNFYVRSLVKNLECPVLTYGFKAGADLLATNVKMAYSPGVGEGVSLAKGMSFKLAYKAIEVDISLPYIISKSQVYSALAASSVGIHLGMTLVEIAKALKEYKPLPGRMHLLRGKKGNIILDDTYNAAPNSVKAALEVLALIKSRKKTVILGDMLELGKIEEVSHKELAHFVYPVANKVILVGKRTTSTHKELRKLGFPKDKIFHFHIVTNLIKKLPKLIGQGEVILIKGSQGMRLEKAVEELVSPAKKKYLTRQDIYWQRKKVNKV